MSYSDPVIVTHVVKAATVSGAAIIARFPTPVAENGISLVGRIVSFGAVATTATTVAVTALSLGDGTDANAYGVITVPITTINTRAALTFVDGPATDSTNGLKEVASGLIVVTSDGGSTAGAIDLEITVAYY